MCDSPHLIFLFPDMALACASQALLQEMQDRFKAGRLGKGKLGIPFKAIQIH